MTKLLPSDTIEQITNDLMKIAEDTKDAIKQRKLFKAVEALDNLYNSLTGMELSEAQRQRIEALEAKKRAEIKRVDKQLAVIKLTAKYNDHRAAGIIVENVMTEYINRHRKFPDDYNQARRGISKAKYDDIVYRALNRLPCAEKELEQ